MCAPPLHRTLLNAWLRALLSAKGHYSSAHPREYDGGMDGGHPARELRMVTLSAAGAVAAPLVFAGITVLRRVSPRLRRKARVWNKRLQREIARWT